MNISKGTLPERKTYLPPLLTVHGDVESVTQKSSAAPCPICGAKTGRGHQEHGNGRGLGHCMNHEDLGCS